MYDLTGFQRDILYVAAGFDGPRGRVIMDELEDYYEEELNKGRLYPNLDTLVDEGLLEKGQISRRTNSYSLTERGYQQLNERYDWEQRYFTHGERREGP